MDPQWRPRFEIAGSNAEKVMREHQQDDHQETRLSTPLATIRLVSTALLCFALLASPLGAQPERADDEGKVGFVCVADETGVGTVVPFGSDDSGLYWFFVDDNWEMLVKVLDGCGFNNHYWVFATATTDVEYTLEVVDSSNGIRKTYTNELGTASPAITDTAAFATCP